MPRPPKPKTYRFGPIEASAPTLSEAQANAHNLAETALHLMDSPPLFGNIRGQTFYVRANSQGISTGHLHNHTGEWSPRENLFCGRDGNAKTRLQEQFASAAFGVATGLWTPAEDDVTLANELHRCILSSCSEAMAEQQRREAILYFAWQRAYAKARDDGLSDEAARQHASTARDAITAIPTTVHSA